MPSVAAGHCHSATSSCCCSTIIAIAIAIAIAVAGVMMDVWRGELNGTHVKRFIKESRFFC
jgi:hypothetical protein